MKRWLVLANPGNRRVALFQGALAQLRQPPARVVSYLDALRGKADWEQQFAALAEDGGIFRLESPGEDHAVERLLIAKGAAHVDQPSISAAAARRLRPDAGRVRHARQWFAGYAALLTDVERALARQPGVAVQNHPAAIRTLFDKPRCHQALAAHGVRVPPALPPVSCYDELRAAMRAAGLTRVFVKLWCGSSASGVVAFSTAGTRPLAVTPLELVRRRGEARFYNNLRLSRYDRERELRTLFDYLCREGVHVEAWLPKAAQAGRTLDLRVVTIAGLPCHTVVRTTRTPFTNLHLGNRRGDLAALKAAAGKRWSIVDAIARQAAQTFPDALYVGWDVLVTPGFRRAYILEGNAFGDLLPQVLHRGASTYAAIARRSGR